jgi:hypothetical protein
MGIIRVEKQDSAINRQKFLYKIKNGHNVIVHSHVPNKNICGEVGNQ